MTSFQQYRRKRALVIALIVFVLAIAVLTAQAAL
jgi:hypothetical protein